MGKDWDGYVTDQEYQDANTQGSLNDKVPSQSILEYLDQIALENSRYRRSFIDNTLHYEEYRKQELDAEVNLNNTRSNFYTYTVDYGHYLESTAPSPEFKVTDNTKKPYYIYPTYQQNTNSNAKAQADKLASDLAFSQLCKQDTVYPYNCNDYDNYLAKNYSASHSPYISGYTTYAKANSYNIVSKTYLSQTTTKTNPYQFNFSDTTTLLNHFLDNLNQKKDQFKYIGDLKGEYERERKNLDQEYLSDEDYGASDKTASQSTQTFNSAGTLVLTAGITSQLDSPLPGLADLVGGVILVGAAGVVIYGVGQLVFEVTTTAPALPDIPDDLLDQGYEIDTTHNYGRRYVNPDTGDVIDYHPAVPGKPGWGGKNHYHRQNPNSSGKGDKYLDSNGNPVPGGSGPSHIPAGN